MESCMNPLIVSDDAEARERIEDCFEHLGPDVCEVLAVNGIKFTVLRRDQMFSDVSPALRRLGAGVDRWPLLPAGGLRPPERHNASGPSFTRGSIAPQVAVSEAPMTN